MRVRGGELLRARRRSPDRGEYPSTHGLPSAAAYAQMLKAAGTVGFSLYLAETTSDAAWQAYGQAITTLGIAA